MSNNCLVTKLKGTVSNDELPKIDEVYFRINPNKTGDVVVYTGTSYTIRVSGNAEITYNDSTAKSFTVTGNGTFTINNSSSKSCCVFLDIKYKNIAMLTINIGDKNNGVFDIDLSNLVYTKIQQMWMLDNTSNFNTFFKNHYGKENLSKFFNDASPYGKLEEDVFNPSVYQALDEITLKGVEGKFKDLPKARLVSIQGSPNLTGSVEDYVTKHLSDGAGSIGLYWPKVNIPNVTYQGQPLSTYPNSVIPQALTVTLSWDAQGNISWS